MQQQCVERINVIAMSVVRNEKYKFNQQMAQKTTFQHQKKYRKSSIRCDINQSYEGIDFNIGFKHFSQTRKVMIGKRADVLVT